MKFWHVTVMHGYTTVFQKKCLTVGEANDLLKEKKEEYKGKPEFMVTKDNF
jgi:hypothetical protein